MDIGIIGGGISGVSLAYYLSALKKKRADINITVFDRQEEPGGCIRSLSRGGYLVESGPNGILNSKSHVRDLYEEAGLGNYLTYSSNLTSRRYIQLNNRLNLAPQGPAGALTTPLLSFGAKFRILQEPFIPKKETATEESVYDFAARRIGPEAAENLVSTLIGGIFAGDARKLSIKSAFPRLYALENDYGGLIKGMIGKMKAASQNKSGTPAKNKSSHSRSALISSPEGMQGLVKSLADKCNGVNFCYHTQIKEITKKGDRYTLDTDKGYYECDRLAVCCNAHDAEALFRNLSPEMSAAFSKVEFAPIFICGMGFDRKAVSHPLDGFGYLVAPAEHRMVLGTLFSSSLYESRAPEGKVLLTAITVGDHNRDLIGMDEEELKKMAFNQIKDVLGITAEPESFITFKYDRAIPQYYIGHSEIVADINHGADKLGGIYIGGNTAGGISVADCILTSKHLAGGIAGEIAG